MAAGATGTNAIQAPASFTSVMGHIYIGLLFPPFYEHVFQDVTGIKIVVKENAPPTHTHTLCLRKNKIIDSHFLKRNAFCKLLVHIYRRRFISVASISNDLV